MVNVPTAATGSAKRESHFRISSKGNASISRLICGEFRPKAQKCKPFSALLTAITTTNATNNT